MTEFDDGALRPQLCAPEQVMAKAFFVGTESLDLANDPRFAQESVIDKRLTAFAALSAVSGILLGNSLAEVNNMNKHFRLDTIDGILQFVGLNMMFIILIINVIGTYVGVAQPYHVWRLSSSGPNGFEMAVTYYMNPNISFWRHFAINSMLRSLPLYLFSFAVRILVKFDRGSLDYEEEEGTPEFQSRLRVAGISLLGFVGCVFFVIVCCFMVKIHMKHEAVYQERYKLASGLVNPLLTKLRAKTTFRWKPDV
uniref:Uncharacterized protein n=1 Tax=Noctiluca scintillans TaxID=2966 RepID=A0A7S1FJ70_NOCSC|mmetsp:Transcript_65086/g.172409  ORF Transcript_65086/g.172409 Transcript_65086/m.172409 type:complete len:253 (+) Transcript_65086:52-810(+)|eukprot:CAMPEP_0194503552 /NCGR_PEP_ID=MMETSP0253-20130528/28445_1 /TAXON_ID=2966 /ORGANISM="Noctiluca scintillans" /LENGTH=252 /DNA_ID=CAMNT_0039345845 /DNA_START=52 /DNA_END=810 /DNA_ORIENTATION=-